MASTTTSRILHAVTLERERQVRKWGEQHHADSSGPIFRDAYAGLAQGYKTFNDNAVAMGGDPSWDTILLEEVYEALAEGQVDEAALEKELIETAAVCVAWVEDIRSRRAATGA